MNTTSPRPGNRFRHLILRLILCGLALPAGCRTLRTERDQREIADAYYDHRLEEAAARSRELSAEQQESTDGNALLWHLEAASINLDAGHPGEARRCLDRAEKLLYRYDGDGSQLQFPGATDYTGSRSERLALHLLKGLCYLHEGSLEDYLVELRRLRRSQFNYLLNEVDPELRQEFRADQPPPAMARLLADTRLKELFDRSQAADAYTEYSRRRRPGLSLLLNPLGFYLSALGYYFDNDYQEAAIDLGYLLRLDPGNELFRRDYVTLLKLLGDPVPEALTGVQPWPYDPADQVIYLIFAEGEPPAWEDRSARFQLPDQVPADWRFSLPTLPARSGGRLQARGGGNVARTVQLADLGEILRDEFWQLQFPQLAARTLNAVTAMTAAHRSAQIQLATALAMPDYEGKELAVLAARLAVEATSRVTVNQREWRRWRTLPRNFQAAHLPLPADRKLTLEALGSDGAVRKRWQLELGPETQRALLYVREINGQYYLRTYESME